MSVDLATLPAVAFGRWRHSREEDSAGVEVYRPAESAFPPSSGRDGFELRADGRRVTRHADPAPAAEPSASRLIAFTEAHVAPLRTFPARYVLRVSGFKPFEHMVVDLVPMVHVRQPDFWEIEVVGSVPGPGLPRNVPYTVSMPLGGTLGSCGIEVVGAGKRQQFDLFCGLGAD